MTPNSKASIVTFFICVTAFSQTFSFNPNGESSEYTISKPITYLATGSYGFDFNTARNVTFNKEGFTIAKSTYFSVALPEGNYTITAILKGVKKPCNTTIKAESRELIIANQYVAIGKSLEVTFNVHVYHTTIRDTNEEVILKDREVPKMDWDKKLTLEFLGSTTVSEIKITPAHKLTTIYLAGDSTVTNQDVEPWASWGQFLPAYVNHKAVVANYAFSGATLQSFKNMRRLEKIASQIKKGDYLLIEFGHNDEKIKGEGNGAYGLYTNTLKEYIAIAREKGAIPILVTPTQRRFFKDNKLVETHGDFPDAMRKVALTLDVPLIDVTQLTTLMYESWGDSHSRNAFVQYPANTFPGQDFNLEDNTHFNGFGANEIALAVINDIKKQKVKLGKYLKKNIPVYDANHPNTISVWNVPPSPRYDNTKPYGN
ncbi:rhamnogalacturonan acetylesterase [Neptunitalea chrysea]|uniref:Rhamnogalacturonan acetylesterase n=1 Tax=Neptunitalea chrysea TaxID=1647581 RepID=A0A9W6EUF3_9FLAO|nr:rhamnogalacturonan acetylesterase [Neptunitalea chrysea]GLB51247.1 rhamnogalacturonan acetylesterase [Neptunitalea chrysea]